jgi:hypothetical protein
MAKEKPRKKTLAEFTPEQQAAIEAIKRKNRTPEARAEFASIHSRVREEFPPADRELAPGAVDLPESLKESLLRLRDLREQLALSLTDVSEQTGLDRSTVSRLERAMIFNPTLGTVARYAKALGRRLTFTLER